MEVKFGLIISKGCNLISNKLDCIGGIRFNKEMIAIDGSSKAQIFQNRVKVNQQRWISNGDK